MLSAVARWWRERRRIPIPDTRWAALQGALPWVARLGGDERARLRELAERFLRSKHITGAGGLAVTADMRSLIAVQACLPVLNLGLDWYRGWYTVIVYPDDFIAPYEWTDEAGVVHEGERELSGEAWPDGPVVLSWAETAAELDGGADGNLVIHEFAHKLDLLSGDANGSPPLHRGMSMRQWSAVMGEAYERFCALVDADAALPFDAYAAEDPGEFFAVTSETYFIDPDRLRRFDAALYAQLDAFYRPTAASPR